MLMCVYGGSRWVDAGAQAACEKESQIQREHRNVSMSDSSCVHARMCDLHPRNSNMFEVIGLHLGLWCSYIKQHGTKPPDPHSEPSNKGLKQYPL